MDELIGMDATEIVSMLRAGTVSASEVLEASIRRIEAVDGDINALPIRCYERAREQISTLAGRTDVDPSIDLAGLPIAVKDYNDVGGVRTTYGSPIFSDHVPAVSDATVRRLEHNGAVPVAKSNVPEWAGGHTFNPVFGTTRNPWDLGRSAGGSSGGSAAAVAAGEVWLAPGNDLGGSLRTPAAFNGVVGVRPGPGRVPRGARLSAFDTLWVEGPIARNVRDAALMLDAGCGFDVADPLTFPRGADRFVDALERGALPCRAAFSPALGVVPMEPELASIAEDAARELETLGVALTDEAPDFTGALESFQTLRAVLLGTMMAPLLAAHRERIAPEIVGNIERGLALTPQDVFEAERARWMLFQRVAAFFEHHDLLICPAASIAPFPVEQRYVEMINGQPCETYIDWFSITFALTLTACPVVSLPCGFTAEGLPVGIQVMGRPRGEAALLRAALALESVLGIASKLPREPVTCPVA